MGSCHFVRAEHLRVPIEHKLAKDEPNPNERKFDSDAKRSICMAFGYSQDTFRLELVDKSPREEKYNVYAGQKGTLRPGVVGTLTVKLPEWES